MKNILNPADISKFKLLIDESKKIVLTCHLRPDGDAIGSTLGLCHLLKTLGKEAAVVIPDRAPRSLCFLPGVNDIAIYTQYASYCDRLVNEADLIIMCDFNTPSRQGDLAPVIEAADCKKVLIDHHLEPDVNCNVRFSMPEMSSACELAFRIIAACGWYMELNKDAATCILTGLITDTQNFTVNSNNPEIYEILMRLLEKEVDKKMIVDEALKSTTADALRLNSFALLKKMTLFEKERCALITLSQSDLNLFHYQKGDTEGLVNMPLGITGIVYSVFMREDADCIKVSTRSKFDFPVSEICKDLFKGGGHLMAAGGEFHGSLQECIDVFLNNKEKYNKYLPKKLDKIEADHPISFKDMISDVE